MEFDLKLNFHINFPAVNNHKHVSKKCSIKSKMCVELDLKCVEVDLKCEELPSKMNKIVFANCGVQVDYKKVRAEVECS